MKKVLRYTASLVCTSLLILALSACLTHKTVIRNYPLTTDSCDCITRHPLLVVGTKSTYFSKEKAFCTHSNYPARRDSVSMLEDLKYRLVEQIENEARVPDSLKRALIVTDSILQNLKKEWTHATIKTKWKGSASGGDVFILKQKTRYYNRFNRGRKLVLTKVYLNNK